MKVLKNPLRGMGLPPSTAIEPGEIVTDPTSARVLFEKCPIAKATMLVEPTGLAAHLNVKSLHLKDERDRLGLGNFKAMGAAHAIAKHAAAQHGEALGRDPSTALSGVTFVCASAGNHGLSMAAGARVFGAKAIVYIAATVPETFADLLRAKNATVIREGEDYEASMEAAKLAALQNDWHLLSDSTWPGYHQPACDVMEGYLIMGDEVGHQMEQAPSHVFIQAGVGGLAAAVTAMARRFWGEKTIICVVEPEAAPALFESIAAAGPVTTPGPVSNMGRLDCKEPSHLALKYLAKNADFFVTISDKDAQDAANLLASHGIATTPTGAAGLAALAVADRNTIEIDTSSRVLAYITEGSLVPA